MARSTTVTTLMLALSAAAFTSCGSPAGPAERSEVETRPVAGEAEVDPGAFELADAAPRNATLVDLDGGAFDPFETDREAIATVFVFARTDCPISNRYAPEVRALHDAFAPRGVRFRLVYADPDESVAGIRESVVEYAYPMPAARDVDQDVVRWADARVTPEVAIWVPGHGLVYRGRIDDRYVAFGKARPEPSRRDVDEVLTAVLDGEPTAPRTTEAVGCAIRRIVADGSEDG